MLLPVLNYPYDIGAYCLKFISPRPEPISSVRHLVAFCLADYLLNDVAAGAYSGEDESNKHLLRLFMPASFHFQPGPGTTSPQVVLLFISNPYTMMYK